MKTLFGCRLGAFVIVGIALLTPVAGQADGAVSRSREAVATGAQASQAGGDRVYRRAERLSRRLAAELDEARRARDVRRTRCLDTTLTEVDATLRMLDRDMGALDAAVAKGDAQAATRERGILALRDTHLDALDGQRHGCLGERLDPGSGETYVEVFIEPGVPHEDPTRLP